MFVLFKDVSLQPDVSSSPYFRIQGGHPEREQTFSCMILDSHTKVECLLADLCKARGCSTKKMVIYSFIGKLFNLFASSAVRTLTYLVGFEIFFILPTGHILRKVVLFVLRLQRIIIAEQENYISALKKTIFELMLSKQSLKNTIW